MPSLQPHNSLSSESQDDRRFEGQIGVEHKRKSHMVHSISVDDGREDEKERDGWEEHSGESAGRQFGGRLWSWYKEVEEGQMRDQLSQQGLSVDITEGPTQVPEQEIDYVHGTLRCVSLHPYSVSDCVNVQ